MNKKNFFSIILVFFLFSCNSELTNSIEESIEESKKETVEFIYKGNLYSSYYTLVGDNVAWGDEKVGELYQQIQELPNLASLVHPDDKIEYFDNYDELLLTLQTEQETTQTNQLRQLTTDITYTLGNSQTTLYLYADINKGGTVKKWNATRSDNKMTIELPCLMPIIPPFVPDIFNDVLSSFELVDSSPYSRYLKVTLFEDVQYGGKSITFMLYGKRLYISDLRAYTMKSGFLGIGKKSWNDQVSSIIYE
jgi:hypothetical protein